MSKDMESNEFVTFKASFDTFRAMNLRRGADTTTTTTTSSSTSTSSNTAQTDQPSNPPASLDDDAKYIPEHTETPKSLQEKLAKLRTIVDNAQHLVVYTGAGVSTACGLPDYRGPNGLWTQIAANPDANSTALLATFDTVVGRAEPSETHKWIASMVSKGVVKHVMSTNVDNLHVRSGLKRRMAAGETDVNLSELHGNSFVHECVSCGRIHARETVIPHASEGHELSEVCTACGGNVRDIVVGFHSTHEDVPSMEVEYDTAWVHCVKADVMIVFGSSLSVPSACDLVDEAVENNGCTVIIVNRQKTPKDHLAEMTINAPCDDVVAFLGGE